MTNNKNLPNLKTKRIQPATSATSENQPDFYVCSMVVAIWERYVLYPRKRDLFPSKKQLTKCLNFIPSSTTETNFPFSKQ